MTTEAIILARVKTNPTFRSEDNTADAGAALRVDPLASLCADSESAMGKKLLSESVGPPGQQPARADPAHLDASVPPPYGFRKTPSAEPQKIPLLPSAAGVATVDGKPRDWGLNSIASFLKISPYAAASMYPFLDMAYKAALMAPPSPFLYQHFAYPSWCQMPESGSPEDGLFYYYVPAHLSSHPEPDLRMYASSPAAVSPRRSLRGRRQASDFGISPRQDSAFPFNERHLSKSSANSSLSTSTNAGSTGDGSFARDPLNDFVPASASVTLPVSLPTADSREISKRSSAQRCGFSPFRDGSGCGSEPDPPKPTGGSPDRRTTEKSPSSPARTSVDGKVHRLPLDLSAKKMKSSTNGFRSNSDFIARSSYGPQTGDARCFFPPPTRSAKTSEPPEVLKSLNLDQGAVGRPSSQRSSESFSSTQLVRGQDNQTNLREPRQPNVEPGSTSGTIRADSFGLGFGNGSLLPYLTADEASLRRMSVVSGKGAVHRYPVLLGQGSGLTRTPTKQGPPHGEDSLAPAATFADPKQMSETRHGGQNRRPSQTRKADPERSRRASKQPFKSFCDSVGESVVAVEDVDETGVRRGVRAPTFQPHPLRRRCSSPAPAPSKEISTEASLSPPPELPVQQTSHCARTSPEQFSKKKQTGTPSGCDGSARCGRGANGLDEGHDEDQLDRRPSWRTDASQESAYVRCSTARFLNDATVGRTSQADGPVFTRKTTTCGDTPLQVPADVVDADKESCVSIVQREQNSADDRRGVDLRHPAYGCAVGERLGQDPLPGKNSGVVFRDGEKNSSDIMDVQVAEGKDTRISTPAESFSGSLDSRAKYETEESRARPRQERSKPKENQDDETAASREAEPADGPPCDAGGAEGGWLELCRQSEGRGGGPVPTLRVDAQKDAQASSICVTPEHRRANDLVGKDGCSPEKEERQEAPPVTGVAGFHCNKASSVTGLSDLDPDLATNHQRVLGPEPFHRCSISGRWVKRRRTQDNDGISRIAFFSIDSPLIRWLTQFRVFLT
ncbi:uncharacterized protein LOC127596476 [Hippocampus zosterae]|uniref:uncharacterized protein LOC127596476 n=1 Tax=Hippocampus zosterae TaxID=109293 RepID=UPI00223CC431|nr:uncharacterized protein LOC127596476 [Hippocampus zosterae]